MSFLPLRLLPRTRTFGLKAKNPILRCLAQKSTAIGTEQCLLMSDTCVKKLQEISDGQFLRVTVREILHIPI